MGRTKTNIAHNLFRYDQINNQSVCSLCNILIKGKHGGNLFKHVEKKHPEKVDEIRSASLAQSEMLGVTSKAVQKRQTVLQDSSKIRVKLSKMDLENACLELVTINGRPFSLMDDSGFRKIIDPLIEGLGGNLKWTLNRTNIQNSLHKKADEVKEAIRSDVKNKLICLKLDVATRKERSFLGINIQYVKNNKIVLRTLALKELLERHTAQHLLDVLLSVLDSYNIKKDQIYTITTDNGSNMLKAVKLFNEKCDDNETEVESEPDEEELYATTALDDNQDGVVHAEISDSDEILMEQIYKDTKKINPIVTGLRCVAHTLQLAVVDSLKLRGENFDVISKARNIVKILRTPTCMSRIRQMKLKKPIIDCLTRWSSTYDMLKRLLELQEFTDDMSRSNVNLFLLKTEWENISSICDALLPAKIATKKLQEEQLTIGDFFSIWKTCLLETNNVNTNFAQTLVHKMQEREVTLLSNKVVLSGIFLDPRYSILLDANQSEVAIDHVVEVYMHLRKMRNSLNSSVQANLLDDDDCYEVVQEVSLAQPEHDVNITDLDKLLIETERSQQECSSSAPTDFSKSFTERRDLKNMLISFNKNQKRLPRKMDIFAIWKSFKLTHPELYTLSKIFLAVPTTQVSVERLFSGLKFVLSDYRCSLHSELLEKVLLLRCNHIFENKDTAARSHWNLNKAYCSTSVGKELSNYDGVPPKKSKSSHTQQSIEAAISKMMHRDETDNFSESDDLPLQKLINMNNTTS